MSGLARALWLLLAVVVGPAAAAERAFVYHLEGPPASLDPALAASEREHHVLWHLCDALLNLSKDGRSLEPALAEAWQFAPGGRELVVSLRRGVTFHDGSPLDAEAVKVSFERHYRPDHPFAIEERQAVKAQMLDELVSSVEVVDPHTVSLKLRHPGIHYLSQIEIVNPRALARLGKEFGRRPDCAGPFRFVRWDGGGIELAAHDRYWGGRPRIDRLVFRFIAEGRAVVDALTQRQVDFSPGLPDPIFLERLRETQRIRLAPVPPLNVFYLGFYTERPPFDSAAVRRAVARGINVERVALFLGRGAVTPARGPLPPAMRGYDAGVAQGAYDPEAARDVLKIAGWDPARRVGLVHNSAITFQAELAAALAHDLRRIGLDVQPVGKPNWREVIEAVRAREGDMFIYGWSVRGPYPERLLLPLFHSRSVGKTNLTRYANGGLDRLLDAAFQLPDGDAQRELYAKAQRLIVTDAPMVFLYHQTRVAAFSDGVRGLELNLGALPHDKLVRVDVVR